MTILLRIRINSGIMGLPNYNYGVVTLQSDYSLDLGEDHDHRPVFLV